MQRLLLSLLILCSLSLTAQTEGFQPRQFESALMYRISGNGLDKPSYLFGSNHSVPHQFVTQNERFMQIAGDVERITTESDFQRMSQWKDSLQTYVKLLGKKLSDVTALPTDSQMNVVAPEQFHYVDSLIQRYHIDLRTVEDEPWWHHHVVLGIIGNPMTVSLAPYFTYAREALGLPHDQKLIPIDYQMYSLADSLRKEKGQLELFPVPNIDYKNIQVDDMMRKKIRTSIASLGTAQKQANILYQIFQGIERDSEKAQKSTQYYLNQDVESLLQLTGKEQTDKDVAAQIKMKERNEAWIPVIQEQMTSAPTLFVVGFAHLFDADDYAGVLHFLQDAGYTIEPIRL